MRNTFGSNDCRLLCINSSQDGIADHERNPWEHYSSNISPGQHLGCLLNNEDVDELKDFVRDLSSKDIIPNMEQRICVLNQQAFHVLYHKQNNILLGAPTGSGKTISAELAMLHLFNKAPDMKPVFNWTFQRRVTTVESGWGALQYLGLIDQDKTNAPRHDDLNVVNSVIYSVGCCTRRDAAKIRLKSSKITTFFRVMPKLMKIRSFYLEIRQEKHSRRWSANQKLMSSLSKSTSVYCRAP